MIAVDLFAWALAGLLALIGGVILAVGARAGVAHRGQAERRGGEPYGHPAPDTAAGFPVSSSAQTAAATGRGRALAATGLLAWATLVSGMALLALLAGTGWRAWAAGAAPGRDAADALALLAAGALTYALWEAFGRRARPPGPHAGAPDPRRPGLPAGALAAVLVLAGLVAFVAALQASRTVANAGTAPQARTWLLALFALPAGLGLGGWLAAVAVYLGAAAASLMRRRATIFAPYTVRATLAPLRFSYPWLSAACLAGLAWSTVAYAAPWRVAPTQLWLAVAWLLSTAYLYAASGRRTVERPARLHPVLLALLAVLGLLTALLAAWQTPALFS